MTTSISFTPATGQLLLTREELVVLAEEVGADRIRGLDGVGLVHVGVDPERGQATLRERGLGRERADLLGSEAFWVRRGLRALRGRAVLLVRQEPHRLVSLLAGVSGTTAVLVKAIYDQPATFGPVSTVICPAYLVEEIDVDEVGAAIAAAMRDGDAPVQLRGWL